MSPSSSSTEDELRTPLPLPTPHEPGAQTTYQLSAVVGLGRHSLIHLIHPDTEAKHVLGLIRTKAGRYTGAGTGQGTAADSEAEQALDTLLTTDQGHQQFLDAITALDRLAVTHDIARSGLFRRGVANAWEVDHPVSPDAVIGALRDAAMTCTGTIADLGQALIAAAATSDA